MFLFSRIGFVHMVVHFGSGFWGRREWFSVVPDPPGDRGQHWRHAGPRVWASFAADAAPGGRASRLFDPKSMDVHRFSLNFIDFHWFSLIFIDFHWISLIFTYIWCIYGIYIVYIWSSEKFFFLDIILTCLGNRFQTFIAVVWLVLQVLEQNQNHQKSRNPYIQVTMYTGAWFYTHAIKQLLYLGEFSESSKILPDLELSDRCCIGDSRVFSETLSSRRNICSKLETWYGCPIF